MNRGFQRHVLGIAILLCCTATIGLGQPPQEATQQPPAEDVDFSALEALDLSDALDLSISIASGKMQPIEEAPNIVSVITDEDIRRLGVHTLSELLKTVPGFDIIVDGNGRDRIAVRGLVSQFAYSKGVLILFNGHRLNEPIDGGATTVNLRIPLYNIRRVEIIRGPGSALFGTSAFVAVINLVTFAPTNFNGLKTAVSAGSFGTQQYSVVGGYSGGNWGVVASAQYFDTKGADLYLPEDYLTAIDRSLQTIRPPISRAPDFIDESLRSEDLSLNGFYGKFGWNFRFKDDRGGPFLGKFDVLSNEGHIDGRQLLFDVSREFALGTSASLTTKFSFTQSHNRERLTLFSPGYAITHPITGMELVRFPDGMKFEFSNGVRGYVGEATVQKQFTDRQRVTVGAAFDAESLYGVDTRANFSGGRVEMNLKPESELVRRKDLISGSRRIGSLFAQEEWSVSKPLSFTAGLRFDHYNEFGSTVNPRAALVWRMPRNFFTKFLYGRAFRAPTINELSYDTGLISGDRELHPDIINTFEFSLGHKTRNFRGSVNYFFNNIDDLIMDVPGSSPTQVIVLNVSNEEGVTVHGLELEAQRTFGIHHNVFGNYTYQRSRLKRGGESFSGKPFPDVPEHLLNLGATIGVGQYVSLSPTFIARGRRPRFERDSLDRPDPVAGYGILNLNIRLRNLSGALELNGTLNNAFNKKYWDPGNGLVSPEAPVDYPRPGRHFLIGATYRF